MKNLSIIIITALVLFSCKKKDTELTMEALPEQRIGEKLADLRTRLTGAEAGWVGTLTTSASPGNANMGGGYGFYMKFNPNETVEMYSDINATSATTAKTSTYRVKWVMDASLIFDTYNYISLLQDPGPEAAGGTAANGLKSDIEFEYMYANGDSIVLKGKKYQNKFVLRKATAAQKASYESGALQQSIDDAKAYNAATTNKYITMDGINNKVAFFLNASAKTATFQYVNNNDSIVTINGKFHFDLAGITFADGFYLNGKRFTHGLLNAGVLKLYDIDGKEYIVNANSVPILPLTKLLDYNGNYKNLYIGASLPAGVTSGFNAIYQSSVAAFSARPTAGTWSLLDIKFTFTNSSTITIETRQTNGTIYFARATFKYQYDRVTGALTLSNPTYDNNWSALSAQLLPIQNFFLSGPFKVDWVVSSNPSVGTLGGLYRESDPTTFFYGLTQ